MYGLRTRTSPYVYYFIPPVNMYNKYTSKEYNRGSLEIAPTSPDEPNNNECLCAFASNYHTNNNKSPISEAFFLESIELLFRLCRGHFSSMA